MTDERQFLIGPAAGDLRHVSESALIVDNPDVARWIQTATTGDVLEIPRSYTIVCLGRGKVTRIADASVGVG